LKGKSLLGGEAQPLKLNHVNSESAISTRSDFLTRGTYQSSDKHLLPVISEPIVIFLVLKFLNLVNSFPKELQLLKEILKKKMYIDFIQVFQIAL